MSGNWVRGWIPSLSAVPDFETELERLTNRVIAFRIYRKNLPMSRLTDKLAAAAGGAKRQTDKIEARADSIIAREAVIERKTDQAFAPHEGILSEAERGLDEVERALGQMSNGPLPASGGSPEVEQAPAPTFSEQ